MVTLVINKRPIVERVTVRCEEKLSTIHTGKTYFEYDWEDVERYPKGTELFKAVQSVGSSGGKKIHYFKYLQDIMNYLEKWVTAPYFEYDTDYRIAVGLTELKDGKHKKVIINRNSTWRVD